MNGLGTSTLSGGALDAPVPPQPSTSKRKASDDTNPLILAAKRAKTKPSATNKLHRIMTLHPCPHELPPQPQPTQVEKAKMHHRRKSSLSLRGKRISTSFESTGVISQPHTCVSDSSFYKHIDPDLPEPARMRQLLVWCSHRAIGHASETAPQASSSKTSGKGPSLSAEAEKVLKSAQEDVIKMLAEGKIDTSWYNRKMADQEGMGKHIKENAQNARNRQCMATYSAQIQRAEAEDAAWEKAVQFYDLRLDELIKLGSRMSISPSQKAKGKQRAMSVDDDDSSDAEPRIHELPSHFAEVEVARSLFAEDSEGKSPIFAQMEDLQFKVDSLHAYASSALQTINICESNLDHRFALLSFSLASRSQAVPLSFHSALSNFLPANLSKPEHNTDPQVLLRALSRVDAERPPAQVGDAARNAVRQIQRAKQAAPGGVAISDRRLTGVPPPTPRKPPGTPRRATTPGRER